MILCAAADRQEICEANLANRKMQSVQSSFEICKSCTAACLVRQTCTQDDRMSRQGIEHIHRTHECPSKMPIMRWMQEILHQLVDGVSPSNPNIHSVSWLPIVSHTPRYPKPPCQSLLQVLCEAVGHMSNAARDLGYLLAVGGFNVGPFQP